MSKKIVIPIVGMHCRACETLVQEKLAKVTGVSGIKVSTVKGQAEIEASSDINQKELEQAVRDAGYQVGQESKSWLNTKSSVWRDLILAAVVFGLVYIIFKSFNINPMWSLAGSPESLFSILLVGLVAGFSTCMALTGGLIVSLTARYSQKHPEATGWKRFQPHLYFNIGRLLSYFILGGVIGLVGSVLKISPLVWAILTMIVGVVMLLLGLQLTEAMPKISNWSLALPGQTAKILKREDKSYSHFGAGILGALTFFLPCGFTQAMQLYAMTTGSFFAGAAVMFIFALGTLVGLLVAGLATSFIKGKAAQIFFHVIGVLLILFALANIANAWNLLGVRGLIGSDDSPSVSASGQVQELKTTFTLKGDINPNNFTVKAGDKVRLEIDVQDNGSGCMSTIMIPGLYNRAVTLVKGQTIVMEFTPKTKGEYPITCAMGVKRGTLIVQ